MGSKKTAKRRVPAVKVVAIKSWRHFQGFVRRLARQEQLLWRGQADASWKLSSPFERMLCDARVKPGKMPPATYDDLRDSYLKRFRAFAVGSPGCRDFTRTHDTVVWAWGRHHGLRTPLLDWSFKPYVAAFFALTELRTTKVDDAAVFSLSFEEPPARSGGDAKLAVREEHKYQLEVLTPPIHDLHRMRGQFGAFTQLTSVHHFDIESALLAAGEQRRLTKYVFPRSCVEDATADFTAMGMTWATIFPDEEGAALAANERSPDLSQYADAPAGARVARLPVSEPTPVGKAIASFSGTLGELGKNLRAINESPSVHSFGNDLRAIAGSPVLQTAAETLRGISESPVVRGADSTLEGLRSRLIGDVGNSLVTGRLVAADNLMPERLRTLSQVGDEPALLRLARLVDTPLKK